VQGTLTLEDVGTFDVRGFNFSVTSDCPSPGSGSGGGACRTTFSPLTVVKGFDNLTPKLVRQLAEGRRAADAVLSIAPSGSEYLRYRLRDVQVTGIGDKAPTAMQTIELTGSDDPRSAPELTASAGNDPVSGVPAVGRLTIGSRTEPLTSLDWSVTAPASTSGGGGSVGPPTFREVSVQAPLRKASAPSLFEDASTARTLASATVEVFAPGTQTVVQTYELTDVQIVAFQAGAARPDRGPTVDLVLNFERMRQTSQDASFYCYDQVRTGPC
jgi:type VI protein secretion system component Hcp